VTLPDHHFHLLKYYSDSLLLETEAASATFSIQNPYQSFLSQSEHSCQPFLSEFKHLAPFLSALHLYQLFLSHFEHSTLLLSVLPQFLSVLFLILR